MKLENRITENKFTSKDETLDQSTGGEKIDLSIYQLDHKQNPLYAILNEFEEYLESRKKFIILQKVKEIVGVEIDFDEEEKRRFKRILIELKGNKQTVFFNDGSLEGKRIVTFELKSELNRPLNIINPEKFRGIDYEESYY